MAKKPLEIDMIAGSELRDTQGEILSVEGADLSELKRLNDNHGSGFFNSIGRVTVAKKIFKADDCVDDRQLYYWQKIKAPYIYVKGILFDDEDHPNAKAAAAILRNIEKSDCPLKIKASVEGGVISRGINDKKLLARTKIHSIALTFTPANTNTLVEPISLDKSLDTWESDQILIKSVMHLSQTNIPSFRHIERNASAIKIQNNLNKINNLLEQNNIKKKIIVPNEDIIIKSAIEEKVKSNLIEINELIKNSKLKALGLSALLSTAPINDNELQNQKQKTQEAKPTNNNSFANHVEMVAHLHNKLPDLGAIAMVESNGGKNLNHRKIADTSSAHSQHTAGGAFGLMPHSVALMFKINKNLQKKYPDINDIVQNVKDNHADITKHLNSNPNLDHDTAVSLFNYSKSHFGNNLNKIAYSWLNGINGTKKAIKSKGDSFINNHQYVNKVNNYKNAFLKKALTAGYIAGSPLSSTGGAVLQTESLEQKNNNFKYIACQKCGHDQIHSQYQVKCRKCGSGFSLEQLKKLIT